MAVAEIEADIRHPISRSYGELCSVFCEDFRQNLPRYNGTALYVEQTSLWPIQVARNVDVMTWNRYPITVTS